MLSVLAALAMLQTTALASSPASAQPPSQAAAEQEPASKMASTSCSSEAHAAFDFWVGEWEVVTTGTDVKVGDSVIRRVSGGCAIDESWQPLKGIGGTSLSLLSHRSDRWEQVWIGSDGRRLDLAGGLTDGVMVLTGYWDDLAGADKDALVRITWRANPDGSVQQKGEASSSHGLTWVPLFDLTYRPKAG